MLYWLEFAEEKKPEAYDDSQAFEAICRAVLRSYGHSNPDDLSADHIERFRKSFRELSELKASFATTSRILARAAKLASSPVPDGPSFKEIHQFQKEVLKELDKAKELILSPDTVNARVIPRLGKLESAYVPVFIKWLQTLERMQDEIEKWQNQVEGSSAVAILRDFEDDLDEARHSLGDLRETANEAPQRIRKGPENIDNAEAEVKREGVVKDLKRSDLSLLNLVDECETRRECLKEASIAGDKALGRFAAFLKSPQVAGVLAQVQRPSDLLQQVQKGKDAIEVVAAISIAGSPERKKFAKEVPSGAWRQSSSGGKT